MYNAYTDRYIRRGGVILLELCDRIACSGTVLYCSKRGPSVSDCSGQTTVNADMAVTDAIVGDSVAAASDEMDRALHGGEDDEVHVELLAPRPCPISPSVQRRRPLSAPAASSLWLTLAGTALVVVVMTLVATHLPSTQKTTSAMTSAIDSDPDACDVFCQGDVLRTIQLSGLFNVSKDFVDMPLRASPADVLAAFNALPDHTLPTLRRFVDRYFDPPGSDIEPTVPSDFKPEPPLVSEIKDPILREFASAIHGFWKELSFRPCADVDVHPMRHTLLRTRHPIMIVPGGRFRETYYWDTYWIVRGLLACDMVETARHVVENLLDHAEDNHFVPNGGRRYYLSRSQPPLLTLMVADVYDALMSRSQRNDAANLLHYSLGILDGEYSWWMKYSCHAVPVDGQDRRYLLNRYWSGSDKPRPEMYAQDYLAGTIAGNRSAELFSEIAATAESGWDFSNRWLSALGDFATRSTIPVDLNLFLCNVESTLHRMHKLAGSAKQAATYDEARRDRADGMFAVLWSKSDSQWMDYNMDSKTHGQAALASNFLPLWGKCFQGHPRQTQTQAALLKSFANSGLLQVGGVATSSTPPIIVGKYQWDWPNAWAPVQHLLFEGLRQEGRDTNEKQLAREIARRWIQTVFLAYKRTGAIHEKYDATRVGAVGSGGEYVEQVGFGWTNGAVLSMLSDLAREEHQFRVDVDALRKCHDQKYYDCQVIV